MSDVEQSDQREWERLFSIYRALSAEEQGKVGASYWRHNKHHGPQHSCESNLAMRLSLEERGHLKPLGPMIDGAEEYEEIMKGDEIWEDTPCLHQTLGTRNGLGFTRSMTPYPVVTNCGLSPILTGGCKTPAIPRPSLQ